MAARLETQNVTCAASITAANPTEIALTWPPGIVRRITIVIPDGHSGLTGIALGYGHEAIMPNSVGAFISGNDETLHYDITDQVPGVQWEAFVCNVDLQAHSWQIRFELDELVAEGPAPSPAILPVSVINQTGAALLSGA